MRVRLLLVAILFMSCSLLGGGHPDILLITLDTTRCDHLSCYGSERVNTPAIDSIARAGVLFSNASTTAPLTLPSHASIMTGLYPPGHGVRNNVNYRLGAGIPSIASILGREGYRTGAVTGASVLHAQFGLNRGFQIYDNVITSSTEDSLPLNCSRRSAAEVTRRAVNFIRDTGESQFFLWVHYYDPHSPYMPPEPFAHEYAGNLYGGEIAYMDTCLGALLKELGTAGRKHELLTIIVGDHGEDLGDHGELFHGSFLYESTIRVPFIISYPQKLPAGTTCESYVSVVDVLPTIMEIIDLSDEVPDLHGISLLGIIEGEETAGRPIYFETRFPIENMGWSPLEGMILDGWKYIQAPTPELYQVEDDPQEQFNLVQQEESIAELMKITLDSLEAGISTAKKDFRNSTDIQLVEKLISLGYTDESGRANSGLRDPKDMIPFLKKRLEGTRYLEQGNFTRALEVFGETMERDPTNVTVMNQQGLAFFHLEKRIEAVEMWKRSLSIYPDQVEANMNMSMAFLSWKKPDSAIFFCNRVLERNPFFIEALIVKGKALDMKGEFTQALAVFVEAAKVDPQNPEARFRMGKTLRSMQEFDKALVALNIALTLKPDMWKALREKAKLCMDLSAPDDAVQMLENIIHLTPDRADVWLDYGYALELAGREDESIESYRIAVEFDSTSFNAINNLGALLSRVGEYEEAERLLRKAISIEKTSPEAYYNIGFLFLKQGKNVEARYAFSTFLLLWEGDDMSRSEVKKILLDLEG